ncbi:hypothetical protein [Peribacillus simplex]|uniref:hypothetical protein n=1 Tax=Peribacillus simplex TaxID=1478 RepID=UPI003D084EAB
MLSQILRIKNYTNQKLRLEHGNNDSVMSPLDPPIEFYNIEQQIRVLRFNLLSPIKFRELCVRHRTFFLPIFDPENKYTLFGVLDTPIYDEQYKIDVNLYRVGNLYKADIYDRKADKTNFRVQNLIEINNDPYAPYRDKLKGEPYEDDPSCSEPGGVSSIGHKGRPQ